MTAITIYTKGWCPYCSAAKDLLREKGMSFDEIDITGKLKAGLARTRADLARARAAALVARRGILSAATEAYYALALAAGSR